jgi:hypothetical protein
MKYPDLGLAALHHTVPLLGQFIDATDKIFRHHRPP